MRRANRHNVKQERPETSSSVGDIQQHDLTYYIHDRVELMHQVFSVLKAKELKAMAPNCVQHISLNDLQELCTEELLGISSKRLCAILDGAEPPSDTETSSSTSLEKFETISLDSISSDEEILSESSSKKKKKHKHHRCRSKSKSRHKRKSSSDASEENVDRSKASRAGLTVLELLELQARARAIRAQLQQVQAADVTASEAVERVSDDEVEIKEEPAEVVEISSEDEKPKVEDLMKVPAQTSKKSTEDTHTTDAAPTMTKRIKDLIITVPVTKSNRKIKLNRSKSSAAKVGDGSRTAAVPLDKQVLDRDKAGGGPEPAGKTDRSQDAIKENMVHKPQANGAAAKDKQKKRPKKKEKGKAKHKDGSDHDEITLQLSDSEKMDLLEDLDGKSYDVVSSSCTADSESSSDSSAGDAKVAEGGAAGEGSEATPSISETKVTPEAERPGVESGNVEEIRENDEISRTVEVDEGNRDNGQNPVQCGSGVEGHVEGNAVEKASADGGGSEVIEITDNKDMTVRRGDLLQDKGDSEQLSNDDKMDNEEPVATEEREVESNAENNAEDNVRVEENREPQVAKCDHKDKSEGEISDRESSEVEASDVKPEVVCISDEDTDNKKGHKKKKNKRKEKKAKKEKKSKKRQDFPNAGDQNFFSETTPKEAATKLTDVCAATPDERACVDDDVYEVLELSDESSCDGEDGDTVLSKEPTAEEIAALSAKIDEIEREDVITEEEIREHERAQAEKLVADAENITWKDRYLGSRKVKNVLTTANILNAMRKKNKELKRKLEDSKKESVVMELQTDERVETNLEEGSIEQYNTLEGSTKYVDPVTEVRDDGNEKSKIREGKVSKEMKKDAKQLLKMYKKLFKYNDMNRQRDPNKKKKKKHKKSKEEKNTNEPVVEAKADL